ncbi:MAG: DNA polymerase III subunit epsilon [Alphaproteobacteria bacterium]|nr:DNA polymerase III subunit epsilon [Alphaproteobacteria bacterium]
MREIIFDTETTGFNPYSNQGDKNDRIVEIGAIEVIDLKPTGKIFHHYINPERSIPDEVVKIHGIDDEKVKDCPTFDKIAQKWLDFVGDDAKLVAHNAKFDMKFINAELIWAGKSGIQNERVVDTLPMARQTFPGQQATLDALCKKFSIDNSARTYHGALLDSELLLDVYIELRGGKQRGFELASEATNNNNKSIVSKNRPYREFKASQEELKSHNEFIEKQIENSLWKKNN